MKSQSLSDPGSNGDLIEPDFCTYVIQASKKGDTILHVEDTSKINKYIMLGLYNTDKNATLLKNLLGVNFLRKEWIAANRAGEEEAPSFQWLIEVKRIIDKHTLELVQPLWTDCNLKYTPALFNVKMLENIVIKNLYLSSTWNGLFKHHGHKKYYTSKQAQEMDYGWNGINMKRVAHGNIENVIIENYTNPLYVLDSRNITCNHLIIRGYDGHQGIKIYAHACDNLFKDITFYNHYADMLGGEGNSYGNVFCNIRYLNPSYNPVYFDFHGFSEGPMSPPMYTLFEKVEGFSNVHLSGSLHMQPACGQYIYWWNCILEGEKINSPFYINHHYKLPSYKSKLKIGLITFLSILKGFRITEMRKKYNENMQKRTEKSLSPKAICQFCNHHNIIGCITKNSINSIDDKFVNIYSWGNFVTPDSLYSSETNKRYITIIKH